MSGLSVSNIQVVCRLRPLSETEAQNRQNEAVQVVDSRSVVVQHKGQNSPFTFDHVFSSLATQNDVYEHVAESTLDDFFEGINGTILAYGQTGAGKSYTMFGGPEDVGLIPKIALNIFTHIARGSAEIEYTVGLSLMEIHKEQILDLMNPSAKKEFAIHEDKIHGIYVKGLSQIFVASGSELTKLISKGIKGRARAATLMNEDSSRSHAICQIMLTQKDTETGEMKKSHLFLVDLAGSEKLDRTQVSGANFDEAKRINLSLSCLGLVINSLTDPKVTHIPYRDLKLTRILQESLGGNSRTSLIINVSPASGLVLETMSTLRFGSRAKSIKNVVHINKELSVDQLKTRIAHLEKTNRELENELARKSSPASPSSASMALLSPRGSRIPVLQTEEMARKDARISELEQEVLALQMSSLKQLHDEDLKLFRIETAVRSLSEKLSDVELINENLRKHLQISERIVVARDLKIAKLQTLLEDQQLQVLRELARFESKLRALRDKVEQHEPSEPVLDVRDPDLPLQSRSTGSLSPKVGLNLRIVKPMRGGLDYDEVDLEEYQVWEK